MKLISAKLVPLPRTKKTTKKGLSAAYVYANPGDYISQTPGTIKLLYRSDGLGSVRVHGFDKQGKVTDWSSGWCGVEAYGDVFVPWEKPGSPKTPKVVDAAYILKNAGMYQSVMGLSFKKPYIYTSDGKGTVTHNFWGEKRTPYVWTKGEEKFYLDCQFVQFTPPNGVSQKTPKTPTKYQVAKKAFAEWMKGYTDGLLHSYVVGNLRVMIDHPLRADANLSVWQSRECALVRAYQALDSRDKARFMEHAAREGRKIGK
jgi:hypothetical protein